MLEDLPLFAAARPTSHVPGAHAEAAATQTRSQLEIALRALNPDELSPKAALEALYKLKTMVTPSR